MHDPLLAMFIAVILEGESSPTYTSILKEHWNWLAASHQDPFLYSLCQLAENNYSQSLSYLIQSSLPVRSCMTRL